MADRTVTRRAPRAAASGSHLRLVRAEDLMRPVPTAAAIARRNLSLLLAPTALLTVIGLVMILSAGSISAVEGYGTSFWYFNRQTLYAAAGLIGLVVTARVPYWFWRRAAIPLLLALVPVMLLTLHPALGTSLYGASRWIDLGPVTLQPAEFAKFLMVCAAAAILARPWKQLHRPRHAFLPLGPLVAVVAGVVMLQRDLGTTVIICGSVFLLLFAAGLRLRHLALASLIGAIATAFFIFGTEYRRTRFLEAWLEWEMDPSGAGWQLRQGLIALGSGGWLGVGLGNSRQKWDYLPNAHSDFVFAVLGEELGLIGALAILCLFGVLLFAGIRIAVNAPDTFGRLLAAGITGWIGLQTLVNLGAVTGLLPITGVPLPFLSFGGTALVVTLAGVGVVASVALDGVRSAERRHDRERPRPRTGGRRR
ncbi:MAG TPA: putative lipid II flippase FtsW [Actinomycetota bacterium]|nr:putative lipid II flippase FtsW [Actinomycetota bacterium]